MEKSQDHLNQLKRSIAKMEEYDKKELYEKLEIEFNDHIEVYKNSDPIKKKSRLINWHKLQECIYIEIVNLWEKFAIPKAIEGYQEFINLYSSQTLTNIKFRLFYVLFNYLNDLIDKNTSNEDIKKQIDGFIPFFTYDAFRVFDLQFALTSLNENSNEKVIFQKIEDMKRSEKKLSKFEGKAIPKYKLDGYESIFKKNDKYREDYGKDNFRSIAFSVAYKELNLIHTKEKQNFYKNFLYFKNSHQIKNHKEFENFVSITKSDNM
ncbi:MAG: hypothetical protein K9J12_07960 [Melioribacteraceae bacterium]|nr:hypothetical protein [Melioribacteraceae bacterium]MCF8265255.1 hypothetical protein [Melioribacteraceae bacterium]MCF8412950.1 hypothetical protein [Melioribacteraceae bacterium]